MLPVWLSMLGWNLAYATAATTMVQQAGSMDTTVGDFPVPPAAMFVCATATLLVLVPAYERGVLPALRRNQERIEREKKNGFCSSSSSSSPPTRRRRRRSPFSLAADFCASLVPPTPLQRAGCACLTIAAAQFVAAGVESARLRTLVLEPASSPPQRRRLAGVAAAAAEGQDETSLLSVAWLVPQYCLVGVSEFFYVAALEFDYEQPPPRLRARR